jgi:hypothetical protein
MLARRQTGHCGLTPTKMRPKFRQSMAQQTSELSELPITTATKRVYSIKCNLGVLFNVFLGLSRSRKFRKLVAHAELVNFSSTETNSKICSVRSFYTSKSAAYAHARFPMMHASHLISFCAFVERLHRITEYGAASDSLIHGFSIIFSISFLRLMENPSCPNSNEHCLPSSPMRTIMTLVLITRARRYKQVT